MSLAKHWVFTINNPTEEDAVDPDDFEYIIAANEVGEQGTKHIQGYCVFKTRKRLSGAKKLFPRAHLEIVQGTPKEASDYCKKGEQSKDEWSRLGTKGPNYGLHSDFVEWGTLPLTGGQSNKRRWERAFNSAKSGDFDSIPKDMLCRYYASFKRIRQDNPIKPDDLRSHHNVWITGKTGVGKSRYAREHYPDYFDKAPNKWFIGYKDQENILLDDLEPDQCKYLSWYLKRWADLYSFPMESKGGGMQIRPMRVVVTSQYTIQECFYDVKVQNALLRRFKVVNLSHWKQRLSF